MPTTTSPCQQTSRGIRPLTLAIHLLVAGSAVTVLPVAAQTASEEDVLLAPISVTGQGQRSTTTEGTGAYTAEAARTATPLTPCARPPNRLPWSPSSRLKIRICKPFWMS